MSLPPEWFLEKLEKVTEVIDSTKLKCWQTCDRLFFYEHILGWIPDFPSIDLKFGEAMHDAWAVLEQHGNKQENLPMAYVTFMETFRKYFGQDTDENYPAKNPGKAAQALEGYVEQWEEQDKHFKPIYIEVAGTAPISQTRAIHFKCDAILQDLRTGKYRIREKKTASQDSRAYHQQWDMSVQIGTYTHVGYCLFPASEFEGVEMDTTFFYKASKAKYDRRKAFRSPEKMEEWLWHVNTLIDEIEMSANNLIIALEEDPDILHAPVFKHFPYKTESCTKYYGCRYLPFCTTWTNPLRWIYDVPLEFKQQWWDPRDLKVQSRVQLGGKV